MAKDNTHYAYYTGDLNMPGIIGTLKTIDEGNQKDDVKRIQLTICSEGGDLYSSFALYDYIQNSAKPVDIVATGACMSAAVVVLQAGAKRYATSNTIFMVHPSTHRSSGSFDEFITRTEQSKKNYELFVALISQRSGMNKETLEAMFKPMKFLNAEEARQFGPKGLIDGIL